MTEDWLYSVYYLLSLMKELENLILGISIECNFVGIFLTSYVILVDEIYQILAILRAKFWSSSFVDDDSSSFWLYKSQRLRELS